MVQQSLSGANKDAERDAALIAAREAPYRRAASNGVHMHAYTDVTGASRGTAPPGQEGRRRNPTQD